MIHFEVHYLLTWFKSFICFETQASEEPNDTLFTALVTHIDVTHNTSDIEEADITEASLVECVYGRIQV